MKEKRLHWVVLSTAYLQYTLGTYITYLKKFNSTKWMECKWRSVLNICDVRINNCISKSRISLSNLKTIKLLHCKTDILKKRSIKCYLNGPRFKYGIHFVNCLVGVAFWWVLIPFIELSVSHQWRFTAI